MIFEICRTAGTRGRGQSVPLAYDLSGAKFTLYSVFIRWLAKRPKILFYNQRSVVLTETAVQGGFYRSIAFLEADVSKVFESNVLIKSLNFRWFE